MTSYTITCYGHFPEPTVTHLCRDGFPTTRGGGGRHHVTVSADDESLAERAARKAVERAGGSVGRIDSVRRIPTP